jgi:hypothetical protein
LGEQAASTITTKYLDPEEGGSNLPRNNGTYLPNYRTLESIYRNLQVPQLHTACHAKEWYIQPSCLSTADISKSLQIACFIPEKANINLTFQALCIFEKVTIWMFHL